MPAWKSRAEFTTAYTAGHQAFNMASLKIGDIESKRIVIRMEHSEGGKDRFVMLSAQLLGILRSPPLNQGRLGAT